LIHFYKREDGVDEDCSHLCLRKLGVYSYRSVNRVNQVVKQIKVPQYTLLHKYKPKDGGKEYKDAYSIELPRRFKLVQGSGAKQQISAVDVACAFFTSNVFSRAEKPLLKRLTEFRRRADQTEEKLLRLQAYRFEVGDEYLVWRVVERDLNEILLTWEFKGVKGTTWFYVPYRDNTIVFGSSFSSPASLQSPALQDFVFNSPKQLFIEGSRNLHDDHVPLTAKIRNVLLKLLYRGSVPVHQLYSKYLLKSTLDKLIEEKDSLV